MGLMPTHGTALAGLLSSEPLTPEKKLQIAKLVLQTLEDYARPSFPGRPAPLALEDHELIDAYQIWESGAQPGADKRRALGLFGRWRVAVRQAEASSARRLLSLVEASRTFDGEGLHDESDLLMGYAEDEYPGFVRGECPELPYLEQRDWCLVKARDHSVLPAYLRTMKQPRGGVPFHKPHGERDEDVDPDSDQAKMPWD